jgi:hypothetical protein
MPERVFALRSVSAEVWLMYSTDSRRGLFGTPVSILLRMLDRRRKLLRPVLLNTLIGHTCGFIAVLRYFRESGNVEVNLHCLADVTVVNICICHDVSNWAAR